MNWEQIRGNWEQAKGELKVKWGKLTDDDLATINGERDKLVGRLQEQGNRIKLHEYSEFLMRLFRQVS